MKKITRILIAFMVVLGMLAAAPIIYVRADCVEAPADNWDCTGADADGMDAATTNSSTDTVTVETGATVDNPNAGGAAIQVTDGTVMNNGGVSENADAGTGIFADGSAEVTNQGTVDANGTAGAGIVTIDGNVINDGTVNAGGTAGTGIFTDTGDVTNTGTVSADGEAGIGIATGGGDNQVENNGTVSATGTDGVAISTGAGNDTVTLGAGATVHGLIDGGDDLDILKFKHFTQSELAGLDPASGTYGGFTWINFEQLIGLFVPAPSDGGGHKHGKNGAGIPITGPRVYFKSNAALGIESDDKLGIDVFAEPGKIAFISYVDLRGIKEGAEAVRFQVPNDGDWYVTVLNLGRSQADPALISYQVNVFKADGSPVSEEHFDY